jgi:hypothetical protein
MSQIRYEIEVEGAKGFLAPLSFPVAEAALGFIFSEKPKYLTAGAIILNSLWVRGSETLKEGGENYDAACMQAYATVNGLGYSHEDGVISIPHFKTDKEGNKTPKVYKCELGDKLNRETLEDCLSLIMPNVGNPLPLTAGKMALLDNWKSGDKEIKTDPELLICACLACYYLIQLKTSSIKKV